MRALPLISMAQEPQTSSRQLESKETGVVFLPSRVTGFSAMSRKQMMMFSDGRHGSANSSQRAGSFGLAWRLMRRMTCLLSAIPTSFRRVVATRARRNLRNIDGLVRELDVVVHPFCAGGLEPVSVVAIREIGFKVRTAGFVAIERTYSDHAGQDQHILQLAREVECLIGPAGAIAEIDLAIARLQFPELGVRAFEILVDACYGDVLGHNLAEFFPDGDGILGAVLRDQRLVPRFLALLLARKDAGVDGLRSLFEPPRIFHRRGAGDSSTEDAGHQRIRSQPVRAVILIFAFARRV